MRERLFPKKKHERKDVIIDQTNIKSKHWNIQRILIDIYLIVLYRHHVIVLALINLIFLSYCKLWTKVKYFATIMYVYTVYLFHKVLKYFELLLKDLNNQIMSQSYIIRNSTYWSIL